MFKRLVVREVRDCWQAAPELLVQPEQLLVRVVVIRLGNLRERPLLGV